MARRRRQARTRLGRMLDDRVLGYTMVTGLDRFLHTFSPPFVVILGLLLMALIGLVDAVTGSFAVGVFYLVPIGLVTYSRGRWVGTLMAAAAALAWAVVEVSQHVTAWTQGVTYWNILTRFYVYEAIVLLVAPMRDVVLRERELAAREAETADKLRALNDIVASLPEEQRIKLEQIGAMVELSRANTEAEIAGARF